jgi:hypothetical protein
VIVAINVHFIAKVHREDAGLTNPVVWGLREFICATNVYTSSVLLVL